MSCATFFDLLKLVSGHLGVDRDQADLWCYGVMVLWCGGVVL